VEMSRSRGGGTGCERASRVDEGDAAGREIAEICIFRVFGLVITEKHAATAEEEAQTSYKASSNVAVDIVLVIVIANTFSATDSTNVANELAIPPLGFYLMAKSVFIAWILLIYHRITDIS